MGQRPSQADTAAGGEPRLASAPAQRLTPTGIPQTVRTGGEYLPLFTAVPCSVSLRELRRQPNSEPYPGHTAARRFSSSTNLELQEESEGSAVQERRSLAGGGFVFRFFPLPVLASLAFFFYLFFRYGYQQTLQYVNRI